jgi:hypothetical protein
MRDIILFKLIEELENCECVDGCICFKTTDINKELKKDTTFGLYNISIDNDPLT